MTLIGSLFSGCGGLDLVVVEVLGGTVAWHVDNDPAAARVLAHHWPDVPNLGDITTVDWATVAPVDVLTGGFPCQDVSSAGRRAGMRPSTRSGLWAHMAYAINRLRPRLVVIENVRGLLSADAACDLEPCPWCVGDGEGRPLRALGGVLGDLAVLGYDARWCGLRAADVGAPHPRFRVFITAWPTPDTTSRGADATKQPGRLRGTVGSGHRTTPDANSSGREGAESAVRRELLARRASPDTLGGELQRWGGPGVLAGPQGPGEGEGPQRQRDRHPPRDRGAAAADTSGRRAPDESVGSNTAGFPVGPIAGSGTGDRAGNPAEGVHGLDGTAAVLAWGPYGPAVRRWELILGRPAPAPTRPGRRGGQQLSPPFVEWMQGLPKGWVTSVPGLSRNDQLKLLGNGVVPQQASAAIRWLLADRPQPASMS